MKKIYYVDGEFVNAEQAMIPITDLSVVRGYGIFDFFRTYLGKPIQIERNIQRLRNSAELIGLPIPWSDEKIIELIMETIERNNFDDSNIRIVVTGGDALDFITPQDKPRLMIYVTPVVAMPASWYTDGIKIITIDQERQIPGAKTLNYLAAIIAQRKAREAGAVEAVYIDRDGNVREGTTSNLFAFYGDKVVTCDEGILPGITRGRNIEILSRDYTVEERALPYEELLQAEEVILTSANKQVAPIVQIDDHRVGNGIIGKKATKLMHDFQEYVIGAARERDAIKS